MESVPSKSARRLGVVLNLASLFGAMLTASIGEGIHWNWTLGAILIAFLVIYGVTFFQTQVRTGLWLFVHRKASTLDEREHELSYDALRHAYSTFTIVALILFTLLMIALDSSLAKWFQWVNGRPIFLAMLLFAHSLPAAVLAWTRERVDV